MTRLSKREQQLADYQRETRIPDHPQYRLVNEDVYNKVLRSLAQAFLELNTIRARDGIPYTSNGGKSDVTYEHFSSVVDGIDEAMIALTGESAHCHPALYASACCADHPEGESKEL